MSRNFLCALVWLSCLIALPSAALSVRPLQLDEVIDQASTAFEGTCIGTETGRDPQTGEIVTFTTFRIDEVLKGTVGATLRIKQIGGEVAEEGIRNVIPGVPRFNVGDSYVVFMPQASAAGFSSPIGLEQGRYHIQLGEQGRQVGNGRDFKELTQRISAATLSQSAGASLQRTGPVLKLGLEEFKDIVRRRAGGAK
jgi:hypothetical protein